MKVKKFVAKISSFYRWNKKEVKVVCQKDACNEVEFFLPVSDLKDMGLQIGDKLNVRITKKETT